MKKTLLLFVMFLGIFHLNAQCPTGSVLLESQAEVDDFVATYSTTCSDIPFDIEIKGMGITDVSGLDFITSIGGDLFFNNNHDLISINGFNNLTSIGGSFKYVGSFQGINQTNQVGPGTEKIIGFNSLISIGGDFWIKDGSTNISISSPIIYSPSLEEINGFNSVTTIGGDIKFDYMDTPLMTGFNALISFTGNFSIYHSEFPNGGNYNLFPNMTVFDGAISTNRNLYYQTPVYVSLNFLNNINVINGNISFYDTIITSGLQNLVTINGSLILASSTIQESCFTSLISIEDDINMGSTSANSSVVGDIEIPSLMNIGGRLYGTQGTYSNITLDNLESLGGILFENFYSEDTFGIIRMNNLTSLGNMSGGQGGRINKLMMNSLVEMTTTSINSIYIGELYLNSLENLIGDGNLRNVREKLEANSLESVDNLSVNAIDISIENLQAINGNFKVFDGNGGTFEFDNLNIITGDFSIEGLSTNLNLEGFTNLQTIGGDFTLSGISGDLNLESIEILHTVGGEFKIHNTTAPLDLSSFTNLYNIGGNIIITYNSELTSLEGLSNIALVGGHITIRFNENLLDCTAFCEYILTNSNYTISDNSNTCAVTLYTCTINEINGVVLQSLDNIDCVNGSYALENVQVTAVDGTNSYTSFTNENGEYTIILPEGNYTLSVMLPSAYFDATPASQVLNIVGSDNVETVNFCLTYNTLIDDVAVTIIPLNEARPGFSSSYSIVYKNNGTVVQDGELSLVFDDTRVSYISSTEVPIGQVVNTITWSYTNLFPNEIRSFTVTFDVEPPPINDSGNILIYTANITPLIDDINTDDNQFKLRQEIVNSYDPNDKRVLEGEYLLIEDIDEYLHYVIRFQNLGTASAINIRIRDIMSDLIDWDTFQPIEASHAYRVELAIGEDQKLEFIFDNINLPDSTTDEPNSHGYVAFKVKPKSMVEVGNLLHNRAAIYFDFNAPIITNETETRIVEDTDSDTIYNYQDNCPDIANTDQADQDNDGIGDVCDDDTDGDGILNVDDHCPLIANENNNDFDGDGLGDICDDDDDNDGILDIDDDCPYYSGTNTTNGCPFYLPVNNFIIETTSETCVNQNNAKINITAVENYNYEVNLLLNGTVVVIPVNTFTSELMIENLSAGTYELCISISAENYEQCFTLVIEDPAMLNANSLLSRSNEYSLTLIGATTYSIFINEELYTINAPDENTAVTFTQQLSASINNIEVKTEKACQGKYTEIVKTVSNVNFVLTPNPSRDEVFISLITSDDTTSTQINIYDISGRLISNQTINTPINNHKLSIRSLKLGVYFVQLVTKNSKYTQKLIKK